MNAAELLSTLRESGVSLETAGDRLIVDAPKGAVTPELKEALSTHKSEILAILNIAENEIAWRVEVMLPQIPNAGPLPFLVAKKGLEFDPNTCHSCGEVLENGSGYICGYCSRAKHQAIEIAMSKR